MNNIQNTRVLTKALLWLQLCEACSHTPDSVTHQCTQLLQMPQHNYSCAYFDLVQSKECVDKHHLQAGDCC